MIKQITFQTPTHISILDMLTMGNSSKREDDSKIGTFDSGFKYALALALRNNITTSVIVIKDGRSTDYTFSKKTIYDIKTDKSKEVLVIWENNEFETAKEHVTGFAVELGFDWGLEKVFTELYANMLDEGGFYKEDWVDPKEGSTIYLEFDSNSLFNNIVENKDNYILNASNILFNISGIDVVRNPEQFLKVYKNGILVYSDINSVSKYAYNINFGELDERRILKSTYNLSCRLYDAITSCKDRFILSHFISFEPIFKEEDFINKCNTSYYELPDFIADCMHEIHDNFEELHSFDALIQDLKKRADCKLLGKKINTIQNSVYYYSKEVSITTNPCLQVPLEDKLTIQQQIESLYNFKVDVDIQVAEITGSNVIADKYKNCIIVSPKFNLDKDFNDFIVQYFQLTSNKNIFISLTDYIIKLIKK